MNDPVHWSWRSRAVAAFVVVYVAVQVGLPAALLLEPRTQRFGWQMYSVVSRYPVVTAVRADGSRDSVKVDAFLARARAEMDPAYALQLPALVCGRSADVEVVEVVRMPDSVRTVHPCR